MSTHETWQKLLGNWTGTNRLILPGDPDRMSQTVAAVTLMAKGTMCVINYTWLFDGDLQEGQLTLSYLAEENTVEAMFLDTWHLSHKFMHMRGCITDNAATSVTGSYQVPDNPDWGWRIEIEAREANTWQLRMFNVSPEGESYLGVEMQVAH